MRKQLSSVLAGILMVAFLVSPVLAADAPSEASKQTPLGLYVTAKEAYDMWAANKDKVIVLDVRTLNEYVFVGHAPMAYNIPSKFMTVKFNPEKKDYTWVDNDKFVEMVKAKFKTDDTILVMCRSGQRSAAAIKLMAAAGFTKTYNIVDSFEGDKEKAGPNAGKRTVNGWKNSGSPWTYDLDEKLIFQP